MSRRCARPSFTLCACLAIAVACGDADRRRTETRDAADAETDALDTRDVVDSAESSDVADTDDSDDIEDGAEDVPDASDALDASDTRDGRPPDECPWVAWNEGLVGGGVTYATFDPRAPGVAFAAAGGTLQRSLDDGATFVPWSDGPNITSVVFPEDDHKALLAGSTEGIFSSKDSGKSFTPLALGGLDVRALAMHPALPQRLFAGTDGAGIMRSDDGGTSWRAVNVGVPRMIVEAIAAPANDANVAIATGVRQNESLGPAGSGLILRTEDGGASWQTIDAEVPWGYDVEVCPANPRMIAAAVRKGVLTSVDSGKSWERIDAFGIRDALDVAYAAGGCDRLWISVYREGVYRLDGDSLAGPFTDFDLELRRFQGSLAAHPEDPDALLLATHAGLYRTIDAGLSWDPIDAAQGLAVIDLASAGERSWITTWGGGLWTRTVTDPWHRVRAIARDFTSLVTAVGGHLLVSTAEDVRTAPLGENDFRLAPGLFNATDAIAVGDPPELFATSQVGGVQTTADPATTWMPKNQGLTPFPTSAGIYIDARSIALDPRRPDRMYVALRGNGVALSQDRGGSWRVPENQLTNDQVVRLAIDGRDNETRIYALVYGKGIWLSTDGALSWGQSNQGLDTLGVIDLVLDPSDGRLYVSEANGVIKVSDDGLVFDPFDSWCLPEAGWGAMVITEHDGERWLVAASSHNIVMRHRLD